MRLIVLAIALSVPLSAQIQTLNSNDNGAVSRTKLNSNFSYLNTQVGLKLTDPMTTTGDLVYRSGGGTTRLAIGSAGQCLTVSAGVPTWAACASTFAGLGTGTNTTSTFTCGTGCSITYTGSGTNNANRIAGVTVAGTTGTGNAVFSISPTITTPTIAATDWANAVHTHATNSRGGQLTASTALNATGTPSASTCLLGNDTWGACGTGSVTVVSSGNLASGAIVTGGGSQTLQTISTLATLDSSGNISTPGSITTGAGGTTAGGVDFKQGTALTPPANSITMHAPTSVATAYTFVLPGASATGFMLGTNSSNVNTISMVSFTGTGNVVRAAAPTITGVATFSGTVIQPASVNVASDVSGTTTLTAGNTFHITGTNNITTLNTCDASNNGRVVRLIFDGVLTFTDGSNLKLAGNLVTSADDTISLVCDGTNWYELARSVN